MDCSEHATKSGCTVQSLQYPDDYDFPICTAMDLFDIVHEFNRLEDVGPTLVLDLTRSLESKWPPALYSCDDAEQTMSLGQSLVINSIRRRDLNRTFSELFPEHYR